MTSVTLWGVRGSLATPGPETARWGGNTSCVEVLGPKGTRLVLDAGTGIHRLGNTLPEDLPRVDVLLTHLHLDHIQGLGFFAPLYRADAEVHVWGPASITQTLRTRLARYLSPPLFPVHLRDLPCQLHLHEVPDGAAQIGEVRVLASLVCHPGPTVGYRIEGPDGVLTYLPDHEPALGRSALERDPSWVSGHDLARQADLLLHDAQYTRSEYDAHVGWGHSRIDDALAFAELCRARRLIPFHHAPDHNDDDLDGLLAAANAAGPPCPLLAGREGTTFQI